MGFSFCGYSVDPFLASWLGAVMVDMAHPTSRPLRVNCDEQNSETNEGVGALKT